jgi:hypothetical protein
MNKEKNIIVSILEKKEETEKCENYHYDDTIIDTTLRIIGIIVIIIIIKAIFNI